MNKPVSIALPKLLLPLLLLAATITKAQEFGGNPPSIKWKQVNMPAARIIFPNGLDTAGLRVANIVTQMNGQVQPTIGFKQRQISIVLQNQTTIANGYVGLAPFRSEFYLTPEQNSFAIGSLPWPQQLAIHEFRHVQQYNNFNVGLSHFLRILFGEGGQALGNDLAVPNWLFEGDAVFNETLVSRQGRGRIPYFFNGYRALWAAGKDYSFMKLRNGSYVDYTPDHYPLGYMLVAYGRDKYGDDFWKKVTHDAAAYNTGFYPFQTAVKKYSGKDFTTFKNDGLAYFKQQFDTDPLSPQIKKQHFNADREYPAYINDSTLIYTKSTYEHVPAFYIKTGNTERKISTRSTSLDNYFNYNNGKVVYATYRADARWGYRNYSELMLLDVKTGHERRITTKTKYFSPAFSADGKMIVTAQVDPSGASQLHLLDSVGRLIKALPNPQKLFYTYPKFYGDDKLIAAVRNPEGKMSIALINAGNGDTKYLLPFTYKPVGFTAVKGDTLYFTSTLNNEERLFALMIGSNRFFELLPVAGNTGIGSYQPTVTNNKMAWVGFTAIGYKITEANKKDLKWVDAGDLYSNTTLPTFGIKALTEDSATDVVDRIVDKPLPITNYSKAHGLFNFHSIIPNISDPNYSFAITGENVLNTFQSEISFDYNNNEGYKQFGFDAIYGALYPYISGGADYTIDRRQFYKGSYVYWNETELHGGLSVPLNFSAGTHTTGLNIGSNLYYNRTSFQQPYSRTFADRSYAYLSNYISFSDQSLQAQKNINPPFAQSIGVSYKAAVTGAGATQLLATGAFYFPGLFINHSFVISVAHQQKGKDNVIGFSNDFPFSKGYTAESLDDMNKIGLTYHLPLAYPDAGFGNIVYLLRLRTALFFDYTHATADNFFTNGASFKQNFRSAGGTVYFDTKFFNQNNISFGIRYSRLLDEDFFGGTGRNRIELVLPVSFF